MRLLCVGYVSPSRQQVAAWADRKTAGWGASRPFFREGWAMLTARTPALNLEARIYPLDYRTVPAWIAVVSADQRAPE